VCPYRLAGDLNVSFHDGNLSLVSQGRQELREHGETAEEFVPEQL
jgi:hypothetical protein